MNGELIEIKKPEVPAQWDYQASVEKTKGLLYKWKTMTQKIAAELYIAREMLSEVGNPNWNKSSNSQTWSQYCLDIGSSRQVVNRWLKRWFPDEQKEIGAPELPEDKFRVIYADPPWRYKDELILDYGAAHHHYPTMRTETLCELRIPDIAMADSVLFLWTTAPFLMKGAPEVIKAWGFVYKACFVWDKVRHNYGHYMSVRHELLLINTRGSCVPDSNKLFDSVQEIERSDRHSQKPEEFRDIIDTLYTNGKRVELFARQKRQDTLLPWVYWGAELNRVTL